MLFPLLNKELNTVLCFVKCKRSVFYCSITLTSLFQFIRSNDPYVPRFHKNKMFSVGFSNAFLTTSITSSGSVSIHCRGYASVVPDMFIPNTHNSWDTQIPDVRLFWRLISGGLQGVSCFVSLVWRLEFGSDSLNFWKSVHPSTTVYGCPQRESATPVNHRPFVCFLLAHTVNVTER